MGSHQRFQRFTVRRQNNHRIGGQPGHHDFPSQLPIRHATAPPIRLLFCYRKAASLRLPSYLHARRSRNFRSAVLVKELATKGSLHVLRHGFKCFGKTYQMAVFKPASGMNPDTIAAYEQNIVTITRQVPFKPATTETVDVVLALNGIPVVTAELKNPMSGQTVEDAKHQYANDR